MIRNMKKHRGERDKEQCNFSYLWTNKYKSEHEKKEEKLRKKIKRRKEEEEKKEKKILNFHETILFQEDRIWGMLVCGDL